MGIEQIDKPIKYRKLNLLKNSLFYCYYFKAQLVRVMVQQPPTAQQSQTGGTWSNSKRLMLCSNSLLHSFGFLPNSAYSLSLWIGRLSWHCCLSAGKPRLHVDLLNELWLQVKSSQVFVYSDHL